MKNIEFCGSAFEKQDAAFTKILCLGYYDGPTSGLALCAKSETAYRFEIAAWDSHYENRVYSLAQAQVQAFNSLVQILTQIEPPRWPVWVPRWQFDSTDREKHIGEQVDKVLVEIPLADRVIATDDLDKHITACRELDAAAAGHLPKGGTLPDPSEWEFWQEYLRLGRG